MTSPVLAENWAVGWIISGGMVSVLFLGGTDIISNASDSGGTTVVRRTASFMDLQRLSRPSITSSVPRRHVFLP